VILSIDLCGGVLNLGAMLFILWAHVGVHVKHQVPAAPWSPTPDWFSSLDFSPSTRSQRWQTRRPAPDRATLTWTHGTEIRVT